MGIHKTKKLIKVSLYAAIIACAAGATTGTYAWYSYQKDIAVDMVGTTIKADKEIQVGLRYGGPLLQELLDEYSLGEIDPEENVKYNANDSESFNIYWIRGNYLTDILSAFHKKINSAQGKGILSPITAGKYSAGAAEDIGNENAANGVWNGFKKTPDTNPVHWKHGGLVGNDKSDLFYLPLAFRALSNEKDENGDPVYLPNVEVFLSSFESEDKNVVSTSGFDLSESIRCKVDYPSHVNTSKNFIFDPNAAVNKDLKVGDVLNLSFDPYYDYDEYTKLEIPYGEWDSVSYASEVNGDLDPTTALHAEECTTFLSNHKPGMKTISSSSVPSKCQTFNRDKAVNSQLTENAGKNIAKTDCLYNYGYVDLSIYLEGWDRNIVNSVTGNKDMSTEGHTFSVQLEFSIN